MALPLLFLSLSTEHVVFCVCAMCPCSFLTKCHVNLFVNNNNNNNNNALYAITPRYLNLTTLCCQSFARLWASITFRIGYIGVWILTRKAHTTGVPSYLKEHLVQHVASRPTRSTALPLLTVPRLTTNFARRSFSYSAPDIWNRLPTNVLLCDCESGFKRHLKTFLFNTCFYSAWLTLSSAPL